MDESEFEIKTLGTRDLILAYFLHNKKTGKDTVISREEALELQKRLERPDCETGN